MKWIELLFAWGCFWIALGPSPEWMPEWVGRIYSAGCILGGIGWALMARDEARAAVQGSGEGGKRP